MRFLELALQGVRSFQTTHRFHWDPGFTVLVGGSGSGKSTLVESMLYLLYPDPMSHGTSRFGGADPSQCRGALTLEDDAGAKYILAHDFLKGSMVLSRQDPAAGKFETVTTDAAEILQFLTSQLHLPQPDIENGLFVLRADRFPSVRPNVAPTAAQTPRSGFAPLGQAQPPLGQGPGPGKASLPRFQGYRGADYETPLDGSPEELKSQLEILERDIARVKQLDEWQFHLDGLYNDQAQLDESCQDLETLEVESRALKEELAKFAHLEKLPVDFSRRIGEQQQSRAKLDKNLARIDDEKRELAGKLERATPLPLWQNQLFQLGMGIGIGALLLGVVGFLVLEPLRFAALIDWVGFAVVTFVAWRQVERMEDVAGFRVKLGFLEERREKVVREHDVEISIVRKYLEEIQAKDPQQVIDDLQTRQDLLAKEQAQNDQLSAIKKDPEISARLDQREIIRTQVNDLEARIADNPPLQMGVLEMEQRVKAIRQKLTGPDPQEALAEHSPQPVLVDPDNPLRVGGLAKGTDKDLCQDLLRFADDRLHLGKEQVERLVVARASQYLAALSANTFPRLHFLEGEMTGVTEQTTQATHPFTQLSPATQDLVYLGLQLALIEACVRKNPVPILLDDPFQTISPNLFELLGRMLAGLGKMTQVILLTSQPTWSRYATKAFKLGP